MKAILCVIISVAMICSCSDKKRGQKQDPAENKASLMEADRKFSKLSETSGMKTAFIDYLDSNGVLLRPGRMPIVGADAIDFLIQQNDSGYTLSWQPSFADVSSSGDMGYTYGVYALQMKNADTTIFGTYVSIWRRQQDGSWKYVLDTGNEGVGSE